jgi:hypothetical protein
MVAVSMSSQPAATGNVHHDAMMSVSGPWP